MQRLMLPQLCEEVLKAMRNLKYSKSMLNSNKQVFSMLLEFASKRREQFLTQSLIEDFLEEKFSFSYGMLVSEFSHLTIIAVRGMKRLQQFASSGHIQKMATPKKCMNGQWMIIECYVPISPSRRNMAWQRIPFDV